MSNTFEDEHFYPFTEQMLPGVMLRVEDTSQNKFVAVGPSLSLLSCIDVGHWISKASVIKREEEVRTEAVWLFCVFYRWGSWGSVKLKPCPTSKS